jgi:hypothetical protein
MMMLLCLLALLLNIVSSIDSSNIDVDVDSTSTQQFSFLAVGDWGGAALDTQAYDNVYAVSAQMAKTATKASPKFILGKFIIIINYYYSLLLLSSL